MITLPIVSTKRSCGTCDQCCRVIGVSDGGIEKPAGVPCEHLCNAPCGNCGIYENRPSACKQYSCMWLDGELPVEAKPEHSGVVGEVCYVDPAGGIPGFRMITVCSRSQSELHVALKRWFDPMLNDATVILGFVTTVDPETPDVVMATTESYSRMQAFMADIRKNGLVLQTADGLQLIAPDPVENGAENVDGKIGALLSGG